MWLDMVNMDTESMYTYMSSATRWRFSENVPRRGAQTQINTF